MIRYVDTSVFVPFFVREPVSASVELWFERTGVDGLALSSWTVTEFVSAIGSKVRARALSGTKGTAVVRQFHLLARQSLTLIALTPEDFDSAARLRERFDLGLRAGDALHAAIARNADAALLVTLDKVLAGAAGKIGLDCEVPA